MPSSSPPPNDDFKQPTADNSSHQNSQQRLEEQKPLRRSAFRALVQDFSPIWYIPPILHTQTLLTTLAQVHMVYELWHHFHPYLVLPIPLPRSGDHLNHRIHHRPGPLRRFLPFLHPPFLALPSQSIR